MTRPGRNQSPVGASIGAPLFAALCIALTGCVGDRPGVTAPEGGILRFDAAMIAWSRDSGAPDPADAGPDAGPPEPDAGPPAPARFPEVPLVHVGHSDWNGLTVVTHNILQNEVGRLEELLVVVRNDGTLTLCSVIFDFDYVDASGTAIGRVGGTFDGEPRAPFGHASNCIPPGSIALGYGNSSTLHALDRVARLEYFFNGSGAATAPTFATVVNENREVIDPYGGGVYLAASGNLRVLSGSILNPQVTIFPVAESGLPLDEIGDIILATYSAGSTWAYRTTGTETTFARYLLAHDYRNAAAPILVDTEETREQITARATWDAAREAARLRRRVELPR